LFAFGEASKFILAIRLLVKPMNFCPCVRMLELFAFDEATTFNLLRPLVSFSSAAEITRAKPTWYFAGSYLRFSACYVDKNNIIRFSEKFPIDTYNKMSTL
jgi:hypothetical protein